MQETQYEGRGRGVFVANFRSTRDLDPRQESRFENRESRITKTVRRQSRKIAHNQGKSAFTSSSLFERYLFRNSVSAVLPSFFDVACPHGHMGGSGPTGGSKY